MGKLYKQKGQSNYTQIPNQLIVSGASLRTIGLWARLAQLPDEWDFSVMGMAAILQEGKDAIRSSVNELEKLGYLNRIRIRLSDGKLAGSNWQINWRATEPVAEKPMAEKPTLAKPTLVEPPQYKKERIKEINNIKLNRPTTAKAVGLKPEYGKPELNKLFEEWERLIGYKIQANVKKNRYSANTLLKKFGLEEMVKVVSAVAVAQGDVYAPRIGDFVELQAKWNSLMAWGKNHQIKHRTKARGVDFDEPSNQ